jgi:hypothetical protein
MQAELQKVQEDAANKVVEASAGASWTRRCGASCPAVSATSAGCCPAPDDPYGIGVFMSACTCAAESAVE